MIRETSILAYQAFVASGALSARQKLVAEAFARFGPGTSAEVLREAGVDSNLNLMRARVTEMRDKGILVEKGVRSCKITKRMAIVFDITTAKPVPKTPITVRKAAMELAWRLFAADAMKELAQGNELAHRRLALRMRELNCRGQTCRRLEDEHEEDCKWAR